MLTYNQLCIKFLKHRSRIYKSHKGSRAKKLKGSPQRKGFCIKVRIAKPKKPNSAKRWVAKVQLSSGFRVIGYICGFGNPLREFSTVLVRGGNVPDLPGVHYKLVRGKYDFTGTQDRPRTNRRSLYGISIKNKSRTHEYELNPEYIAEARKQVEEHNKYFGADSSVTDEFNEFEEDFKK